MHTADKEKPLPHKLCRFTSSLCSLHALLVQHLYSEFFQHVVWYGPTPETVWKAEKFVKIYRFHRAEEDNH